MLVYSSLSVWMLEVGISLKTIGIASTVLAPYKLKLFWAPLVDRINPFWLRGAGYAESAHGDRCYWPRLSIQPLTSAHVSCGQRFSELRRRHDIVVDGYRVELLSPEDQAPDVLLPCSATALV